MGVCIFPMVFFPNETIKLYSFIDQQDYDEYGEKKGYYEFRETVKADVQPLSAQDSMKTFGKILQDTFKAYLPYNTTIHDTDIIQIGNMPETYTIQGSSLEWNHILKHKKIIIQKQRQKTIK